MIHGEKTDWIGRANIILEHGEAVPFDRFAFIAKSRGKTLDELLAPHLDLMHRDLNLPTHRPHALAAEQPQDYLGLRFRTPPLRRGLLVLLLPLSIPMGKTT